LLLLVVVTGCCYWLLLLVVVTGCCYWLLLLVVVTGCCYWLLLLVVAVVIGDGVISMATQQPYSWGLSSMKHQQYRIVG